MSLFLSERETPPTGQFTVFVCHEPHHHLREEKA